MNSTPDITFQKTKWPVKLIIILVIVTVLGFIPWESVFSVELRSDSIQRVTVGLMGLGGLFALLCITLVCILRYNKWYSGLALLLIPVLLLFIGYLLVLSLVSPAAYWQDEAVYRNGDDYLVVQIIEYRVTGDLSESRLIRTPSPYSKIRTVEELHLLSGDDNRFNGNVVVYNGKTWLKQPTQNEE